MVSMAPGFLLLPQNKYFSNKNPNVSLLLIYTSPISRHLQQATKSPKFLSLFLSNPTKIFLYLYLTSSNDSFCTLFSIPVLLAFSLIPISNLHLGFKGVLRMRLETSVVKQKGQEQNLLDKSNKSKRNRKRAKKQMNSVVQRLFETCKEIFGNSPPGFVPSPQEVERLKSVLDNLKPEDVGVTEDMPYFKLVRKEGGPRIVTYLHIYECDKFSIGIFCLPASGMIPLHNHPGMTVFSKLLFGSMHIKSYDWATNASIDVKDHLNDSSPQPPGTQLAKVKMDSDFIAPCNTSILYPADGGNMHCFSALTPCAVLDVLGPPYSDDEGRHCTYFREFPYHNLSGDVAAVVENTKEEYAWLEEKEKPRDFFVVGAPYMGPKVVEI